MLSRRVAPHDILHPELTLYQKYYYVFFWGGGGVAPHDILHLNELCIIHITFLLLLRVAPPDILQHE